MATGPHRRANSRWLGACALALCTACSHHPNPVVSTVRDAGVEAPDASTPDAGGGWVAFPDECGSGPAVLGAAPVRRLTASEYVNTVNDLFASVHHPPWQVSDFDLSASDSPVNGFDNNTLSQSPSPLLVQQYRNAAERIAANLQDTVAQSLACPTQANGTPANPSACAFAFISDYGQRAFRRPLSGDEATRAQALFASAMSEQGFNEAVGATLEFFLQAPQFLYRLEVGERPRDSTVPNPSWLAAAPYELASRLSYFLWRAAPDAALLQAASTGDLSTSMGLEMQARRLLADPRARQTIADFHGAWFGLGQIDQIFLWPGSFPAFNSNSTPALLKASTAKFIDHEMWDGDGTLSSLLTDSHAYVNDALAPVLGVPAPHSNELVLTETDPTQRQGLLTQPGILAAGSHALIESPVHRGVFVLRSLLCAEPPAPPASVNQVLPRTTGGMTPTTRERFVQHEKDPSCIGCHKQIDGIGFGFEGYDALGQYRQTEDNGTPVDASGWISGTADADGPYNGPSELVKKLLKSEQVSDCVVRQHFRYGFGRTESKADSCAIQKLRNEFDASHGDMRELLVQVVLSDSFRYLAPDSTSGAQ
jgi:hypothetical protein